MDGQTIGTITAALIGLAGTYLTVRQKVEINQLKKSEFKSKLKASIYEGIMTIQTFDSMNKALEDLFETTKCDRFLLLVGLEMKDSVQFVKVIFSKNEDRGTIDQSQLYANVEIDDVYRQYIKDLRLNKELTLNVDEMSSGLLKYLYEDEKVTYSVLKWVRDFNLSGRSRVVSFCSMATHSETLYSVSDRIKMRTLFNSTVKPSIISIITGQKEEGVLQKIKDVANETNI